MAGPLTSKVANAGRSYTGFNNMKKVGLLRCHFITGYSQKIFQVFQNVFWQLLLPLGKERH